jgi:hypothetical protein
MMLFVTFHSWYIKLMLWIVSMVLYKKFLKTTFTSPIVIFFVTYKHIIFWLFHIIKYFHDIYSEFLIWWAFSNGCLLETTVCYSWSDDSKEGTFDDNQKKMTFLLCYSLNTSESFIHIRYFRLDILDDCHMHPYEWCKNESFWDKGILLIYTIDYEVPISSHHTEITVIWFSCTDLSCSC